MLIQVLAIFGIIIVGLIFVFRLVFRRDLDVALNRLKKLQEEAMLKEGHLRDELDRARMERASQVEKGKKEAKALIAQAKKDSEGLRMQIKEKAQQEKEDVLAGGAEAVEKLKKDFQKDVDAKAIEFSVDIIGQAFSDKGKEHLQHELIEEFLEDLEKIDKGKFFVNTKEGVLTSSFPMTADEKKRLNRILADKIGSAIKLEEKVDPSLITGCVVRIGDFVVDGSLKNKLTKIIPTLRR